MPRADCPAYKVVAIATISAAWSGVVLYIVFMLEIIKGFSYDLI